MLIGVRGAGKTVLLRAMTDEAAAQGFLVASVTMNRRGSLPVRIASAVAAAMKPLTLAPATRWRRWFSCLERLSVEVPGSGPEVHRSSRPAVDLPAADRDATVALVAESAKMARRDRPGLVVAFDEVQEGPDGDLAVVNALAQELVAAPVVLLGAGLPQTPERLMRAGAAAERFTYQRLGALAPAEATTALLMPASTRQVGGPGRCRVRAGHGERGPVPAAAVRGRGVAGRRPWTGWADRGTPRPTSPRRCRSCTTGRSGAGGTGPARWSGSTWYGRVAFSLSGFEDFMLIEAGERS